MGRDDSQETGRVTLLDLYTTKDPFVGLSANRLCHLFPVGQFLAMPCSLGLGDARIAPDLPILLMATTSKE